MRPPEHAIRDHRGPAVAGHAVEQMRQRPAHERGRGPVVGLRGDAVGLQAEARESHEQQAAEDERRGSPAQQEVGPHDQAPPERDTDADDERQPGGIEDALEDHVERALQREVAEPAQNVLIDDHDGGADEEEHDAVEDRQVQGRRETALAHLGLGEDIEDGALQAQPRHRLAVRGRPEPGAGAAITAVAPHAAPDEKRRHHGHARVHGDERGRVRQERQVVPGVVDVHGRSRQDSLSRAVTSAGTTLYRSPTIT